MDGKRENSMFEEITNGIAFLYKPFIDKIESDNKKSGVPYRHYLPILLDVPDNDMRYIIALGFMKAGADKTGIRMALDFINGSSRN